MSNQSPYQQPVEHAAPKRTNALATASMVLGITGVFLSWVTFGIPSILAVVFGHASKPQIKRQRQDNRGMATAGLVLGYLVVIPSVIAALFIFEVLGSAANEAAKAAEPGPANVVSTEGDAPYDAVTATPPAKMPVGAAPAVACTGHDDKNAPCVVKLGKPFVLGSHTVQAGWKVTKTYGMSVTGKAKNTGDANSSMFISLKFLKGDEVVAAIDCNTGDLEPGQTAKMNCLGADDFTNKYDRITAEATF